MESLIDKANSSLVSQFSSKKDQFFIDLLKENGFEFEDNIKLTSFCKERCSIGHYPDKATSLSIDGRVVAKWYEDIKTEFSQDDYTYKAIFEIRRVL